MKKKQKMHYLDEGKGEVLVLIHGLGSKKESWKHQMELSDKYRLIVPDLRGHGESDVTENISIPQFARDVIALLEKLNIEKAHFCGLSMGGLVVQEIYRQKRRIVATLTLSNTFSYSPIMLKNLLLKPRLKQFYNTPAEEYLEGAAKRCLHPNNHHMAEDVKGALMLKEETYIKSAKAALNVNFLPMLPFVRVPVMIIGSVRDKVVPFLAAKQTYLFAPKCKTKFVFFKDAGHVPNLEKKETYNLELRTFLSKNPIN